MTGCILYKLRDSANGRFSPEFRAIDCHSRYARARLYSSKLPVTAVHLMNNDVIPTFEAHNAKIDVILSDNGREFCGRPDHELRDNFERLGRVIGPALKGIPGLQR